MGLSWYLAWRKGASKTLFVVHLAVNSLWSVLFFGLKSPDLALIWIAVLWSLIVAVMIQFWRYSRVATWLFLPYLIWVSFASYLNLAIYRLNL
jgi:tryptophan-rich sensory protein